MTHRPVKISADGEHVYADGHRYRPLPQEARVRAVRKPADPRAVRWGAEWLLPLDVLEDAQREMPATRPFRDARGPYRPRTRDTAQPATPPGSQGSGPAA